MFTLDSHEGSSYRQFVVKVVERGRYSVYVYREIGHRHHRPHCHVKWSDGDAQIGLLATDLLAGTKLPAQAQALVEEHINEIAAAWNRLNPERPAQ